LEEDQLFADVEKILELSNDFRKKIDFTSSVWDTEMKALRLFESQVKICETIRDLVEGNKYAEVFILNRTLFENYFLICLILKGTKYALKYKVTVEPSETPKEAYNRLAKKLEGRRDIVSLRPIKKFTKIEIVHEGLFSKEGDELTPVYYFVFQQYDPVSHRVGKIKSIASKDFFPDITVKWQKRHESLYKTYFGFSNLLQATILNGILSNEQSERVRVHYNFLSAFTHMTRMGFDLTMSYDPSKNEHYLMELNFLYVIRILRLYLLLLIEFFSKTKHSIRDVDQLLADLDEFGKRYDYFWFIFNGPSEYDLWKYQAAKAWRRRKGEELKGEIPYYTDPYQRLKEQHRTVHELSTGLRYTSPWPRRDAIF